MTEDLSEVTDQHEAVDLEKDEGMTIRKRVTGPIEILFRCCNPWDTKILVFQMGTRHIFMFNGFLKAGAHVSEIRISPVLGQKPRVWESQQTKLSHLSQYID